MLETILEGIAASAPAEALRASRYAYPLVNAAHILGLATLFGAILALDLRLLGAFRAVPAQPLARMLPRVAAAGLATAVATGVLIFSVDPVVYAANPAFRLKLLLVLAGTLHALLVHATPAWRRLARDGGDITGSLKASALLSVVIWTGAILSGRFIAFLE